MGRGGGVEGQFPFKQAQPSWNSDFTQILDLPKGLIADPNKEWHRKKRLPETLIVSVKLKIDSPVFPISFLIFTWKITVI